MSYAGRSGAERALCEYDVKPPRIGLLDQFRADAICTSSFTPGWSFAKPRPRDNRAQSES
jgi:hypothetical protein